MGRRPVNNEQFEAHVLEKAKHKLDTEYCVVALNEEAGEVAGWYKKFILRKNVAGKLTHEDLLSELGDVLYYTTALALHYGWSLSDVMEYNKKKLDEREKKGFKQIA